MENPFLPCREQPDLTRIGFNNESLLLRGCTVRNTEVTIGIVVYAGNVFPHVVAERVLLSLFSPKI